MGRQTLPLRLIVEEDCKLVRTLNAGYADAAHGGLDASERDALFDVLAIALYRTQVPRSGGTKATRRFVADLQHGMIAAGWKVDFFAVTA